MGSTGKLNPRIGGGHIAYLKRSNGSWDVGVYSMVTGTALPIATGPADQVMSDTDGQTVVWIETGAINRLMAYDIACSCIIQRRRRSMGPRIATVGATTTRSASWPRCSTTPRGSSTTRARPVVSPRASRS